MVFAAAVFKLSYGSVGLSYNFRDFVFCCPKPGITYMKPDSSAAMHTELRLVDVVSILFLL